MIKQKFRLKTKDVRYLTKKRQYCTRGIFGFRRVKQYPNRECNQISCHIGVKLSKNATTRNFIRRLIMNIVRDQNIDKSPINGTFYKIFINLDKNKLPELISFITQNHKSERKKYFSEQFSSAFTSFQSVLCKQK